LRRNIYVFSFYLCYFHIVRRITSEIKVESFIIDVAGVIRFQGDQTRKSAQLRCSIIQYQLHL
jgi:hypothetical protein